MVSHFHSHIMCFWKLNNFEQGRFSFPLFLVQDLMNKFMNFSAVGMASTYYNVTTENTKVFLLFFNLTQENIKLFLYVFSLEPQNMVYQKSRIGTYHKPFAEHLYNLCRRLST